MNRNEFDEIKYYKGIKVYSDGKWYSVLAINFDKGYVETNRDINIGFGVNHIYYYDCKRFK